MKDGGKMIQKMEQEVYFIKMVLYTLDNGLMEKKMEWELYIIILEINIMVILLMEKKMEKDFLSQEIIIIDLLELSKII